MNRSQQGDNYRERSDKFIVQIKTKRIKDTKYEMHGAK